MILLLFRLLVAIILAFITGKMISKWKLPSILGWLIAGMILGPHALSLVNNELLNAVWYQSIMHVLECAVGLMIGTELVWRKIKKIRTLYHHYYSHPIFRDVSVGVAGVRPGVLFFSYPVISGLSFRWYRTGYRPGAGSVHRAGI